MKYKILESETNVITVTPTRYETDNDSLDGTLEGAQHTMEVKKDANNIILTKKKSHGTQSLQVVVCVAIL